MIDIEKLKALAEAACPRDDWYEQGDLRYCDDKTGDTHGLHHLDAAFVEAASPAAVLELIAEVETLREIVKWDGVSKIEIPFGPLCSVMDERDQLKAENGALRKDAERYRWLKANSSGAIGVPGGWFSDPSDWDEGIDLASSDISNNQQDQ